MSVDPQLLARPEWATASSPTWLNFDEIATNLDRANMDFAVDDGWMYSNDTDCPQTCP